MAVAMLVAVAAIAAAGACSESGPRDPDAQPTVPPAEVPPAEVPPAEVPPAEVPPAEVPTPDTWRMLSDPIDPRQQTDLAFGQRSHWHQPWRAYLDTPPASRLLDALGVNFNVTASDAAATASLLAQSGFRRARLEIGWSEMSYDDPTELRDPASIRARIAALRDAGIRPLILLNANHGMPGPSRSFDARITEPAAQGARQVRVDAATAHTLVPGLSGLNGLTGKAAEFIATSVSTDGVVELSKPLPFSLPAGTYHATLLRYQPFAPPETSSGSPSPAFEETLAGWLDYVRAVTQEAEDVLGGDQFDVEVWNEMSFGSDFLFADRYYDPLPPELSGRGDIEGALLRRTLAWIRDPANGVVGVGVGDGFANQSPWPAGSTSPRGLTALDKHPYHAGIRSYPRDQVHNGVRPLDALGRPEGTNGFGSWVDSFLPSYRSFFPEYYLSAIQTEHLVRDLSPITTWVGSTAHGRSTAPPGADRPPAMWITETNVDPTGEGGLTAADKRHLQAKATLRTLTSFVNKGVAAIYFYAVRDGDFALVGPGEPGGGETMVALRRLAAELAGARTPATPRSVTLEQIADNHDHRQFDGDGTAAHPPLYNRDVLAVLPFQLDDNRFAVPAYVMTRDMAKVYKPGAPSSDVTRHDLPPETYRLTVGGLDSSRLRASATDPLTGASVPVDVVSRSGSTAVLEAPLTDSPRVILLEDD